MSLEDMGILNDGWGICGVTSCLYALYNHNPEMRWTLDRTASEPTRMLAEISSFLERLHTPGWVNVLADIEIFTRTFEGFEKFTITNFLSLLRVTVVVPPDRDNDIYSVAFPPQAIVAFLKLKGEFYGACINKHMRNECIIGLGGEGDGMYNDLKHWVYYKNGVIYSWGETFGDLESEQFDGIRHAKYFITF